MYEFWYDYLRKNRGTTHDCPILIQIVSWFIKKDKQLHEDVAKAVGE